MAAGTHPFPGPDPTPTGWSPSAQAPTGPSPTGIAPTAVPAENMLQPSDLGAGHWQRINGERFSGDLWVFADMCPAYRTDDYPALRHQLTVRTTAFTDDGAVYPDSVAQRG